MAELLLPPLVLTDFDGTVVEKLSKWHFIRNGIKKYPLAPMPGIWQFLDGVQLEGLELGGIISRRPNIRERAWATNKSINEHGLRKYFPDQEKIILANSDWRKDIGIFNAAVERPIGFMDDKPHTVGKDLLQILDVIDLERPPLHPIIIGGVRTPGLEGYFDELSDAGFYDLTSIDSESVHMRYTNRLLDVHVVSLDEYSKEAGQKFARQVISLSQAA